MQKGLEYLTNRRLLIFLLAVIILITFLFERATIGIGGALLDMKLTVPDTAARLAEMTGAQRRAHLWVTLSLDTIYLLAYGGFLAGFAAHFAGRHAATIALPGLLLMLADLSENMLIVACLTGHEALIPAKVAATQIKWFLFLLALALALGSGLTALVRHLRAGRRAAREI